MGPFEQAMQEAIERDGQGRFVPGKSGNPKGKPPGTPNRATVMKAALVEALTGGEIEVAARVIIDRAVNGDVTSAKFLIGRIDPKPRGRPIELMLPEDAQAADIIAAYDATTAAMLGGEISPDEALAVARFLTQRAATVRALAARGVDLNFSSKDQAAAPGQPRRRRRRRATATAAVLPAALPLSSEPATSR